MAKTGQISLQFVAGHYLQKEKVKYSTYPLSAKEEFDVDIDFPFDYFGICVISTDILNQQSLTTLEIPAGSRRRCAMI